MLNYNIIFKIGSKYFENITKVKYRFVRCPTIF